MDIIISKCNCENGNMSSVSKNGEQGSSGEENVSKSPLKVSLVNLNQPLEPTHQLNNQLLNKQRRKEPEVDG